MVERSSDSRFSWIPREKFAKRFRNNYDSVQLQTRLNGFSKGAMMTFIKLIKRFLLAVVLTTLVFQLGCEKKDANDASSGSDSASMQPPHKTAPPAGFEFETPVRLKAGDEYVSVEEPGYACPTLADVDEDGKLDLVVGQFNNGHMQFFKNIAAEGESPKFAAAEWIKSGDDRAEIPGVS